jgi:hypothetical protein
VVVAVLLLLLLLLLSLADLYASQTSSKPFLIPATQHTYPHVSQEYTPLLQQTRGNN